MFIRIFALAASVVVLASGAAQAVCPYDPDCSRKQDKDAIVLDITDALLCFEQFFNDQTVPRHYELVDITSEALGQSKPI